MCIAGKRFVCRTGRFLHARRDGAVWLFGSESDRMCVFWIAMERTQIRF